MNQSSLTSSTSARAYACQAQYGPLNKNTVLIHDVIEL
jgi:hypothetical protein